MVGIDIVDHSDPLLRRRDQRAFRLVSHPDDSLQGNVPEERRFWLYWAAKESTYKAYRQPIRFNPKSIDVQITAISEGKFTFRSGDISGKIMQNKNITLATCGVKFTEGLIYQSYHSSAQNQSSEIRKLMTNYFHQKGISITISRDALGLPIAIFPDGDKLTTFTHHHHQMAFICQR